MTPATRKNLINGLGIAAAVIVALGIYVALRPDTSLPDSSVNFGYESSSEVKKCEQELDAVYNGKLQEISSECKKLNGE